MVVGVEAENIAEGFDGDHRDFDFLEAGAETPDPEIH
jgi:hypothetical protein